MRSTARLLSALNTAMAAVWLPPRWKIALRAMMPVFVLPREKTAVIAESCSVGSTSTVIELPDTLKIMLPTAGREPPKPTRIASAHGGGESVEHVFRVEIG